MVGSSHTIVDLCPIRLEIVGTKDMVNTEVHPTFMIAYSRSVSTLNKAVIQFFCDGSRSEERRVGKECRL